MLEGKLISFEGISGAGKTTLINTLESYFKDRNYDIVRKNDLKFFTGVGIGSDIKQLIEKYRVSNNNDHFFRFGYPVVETLLILAKRAAESQNRLNPALTNGALVFADRDIDTVCAYQLVSLKQYNPKLNENDLINTIRHINCMSTKSPDLTFYLNVSIENAKIRVEKRDKNKLKKNEITFLEDAKKYYNKVLHANIPNRIIKRIDTNKYSMDEIADKSIKALEKWLKNHR